MGLRGAASIPAAVARPSNGAEGSPVCTALSSRCIKLQLEGEAAQAEAWDWLAANQLSALVTTKESR